MPPVVGFCTVASTSLVRRGVLNTHVAGEAVKERAVRIDQQRDNASTYNM